MTQDDINRMARTAQMPYYFRTGEVAHIEQLGNFAELVAAAEREACAAIVDANAMACTNPIYRSLLQSNADAIRARGQDPMPLFDDWPGGWSCPPCNQKCNQGRDCPNA